MPTLPSVVALDLSIGPVIASAEHVSNYTAIQTAINAIVNALNVGSGAAPYLTGNGSTLTWAALSGAISSYATTLPGSPSDGQLAVLVDSVTAPTYQWLFRWNAGSVNADKWEAIGPMPVRASVATSETTTSTSYADLATVGPSITLAHGGQYLFKWGAGAAQGHSGGYGKMSIAIGATVATDTYNAGSLNALSSVMATFQGTVVAADVIRAKYKTDSGAFASTFEQRWLEITPVRVS